MKDNTDHQRFLAQLMRHEGCKRDRNGLHVAYRCSTGKLTIGYGHNLDANPISGLGEGSCITEDHAREILGDDIRIAAHQVAGKLPFAPALAPARFGVLVNMTFNLGISGLLGFSNTLADVERGDWASAARRMLQSKWAGQVGRRAHELAKQMETGQWQ